MTLLFFELIFDLVEEVVSVSFRWFVSVKSVELGCIEFVLADLNSFQIDAGFSGDLPVIGGDFSTLAFFTVIGSFS